MSTMGPAQVALLGVNMALLAGGIAVQLPQIAKILRNKSTAGLSESAWVLQSFSTGMYVAFNFIKGYDFMLWGDSMFAAMEYILIVFLIWYYGPSPTRSISKLRYIVAILWTLLLSLALSIPTPILYFLGTAPMPMIIIARCPQLLLNYRQKHTGQLALVSLIMQVGGNAARVIGTLMLISDKIVLASHLTAMIFNGAVLFQIFYYWKNTQRFLTLAASKKN